MGCSFCTLLGQDTDPHLVTRNDSYALILDRAPVFAGHTLIVPTRHVSSLLEATDAETGLLLGAARHTGAALMAATGAAGFLLVANTIVSQSVPHLHLHVIPRRPGDGLRGFLWPRQRYGSDQELRAMAAAIRAALAVPG